MAQARRLAGLQGTRGAATGPVLQRRLVGRWEDDNGVKLESDAGDRHYYARAEGDGWTFFRAVKPGDSGGWTLGEAVPTEELLAEEYGGDEAAFRDLHTLLAASRPEMGHTQEIGDQGRLLELVKEGNPEELGAFITVLRQRYRRPEHWFWQTLKTGQYLQESWSAILWTPLVTTGWAAIGGSAPDEDEMRYVVHHMEELGEEYFGVGEGEEYTHIGPTGERLTLRQYLEGTLAWQEARLRDALEAEGNEERGVVPGARVGIARIRKALEELG